MNKPPDVWRMQMWREREVRQRRRESRESKAPPPWWGEPGEIEREPVARDRVVQRF